MEKGEYTKAIARLYGPEQAAEVMTSHLQTIYSGRLLQDMDDDRSLQYHSTPFSQDTCPILLDDVEDALRQLPPKKAPRLPRLLRLQPITTDISPTELIRRINCLLYADDVVLIADKANMPTLFKSCEDHSYKLGYRWSPSKCIILDPTQLSPNYTLYDEPIPKQPSFPYLGIPFRPGGYIDAIALVNRNKAKALATMNQLSAIGVQPKGFSPLLGIRFYSHIVRAQLEYGLAITKVTTFLSKQLEDAQNVCLRRIFGGSHVSSTTAMLHMSKLPTMQERAYALQSQFLLRSLTLPEDALSLSLPFGENAPPNPESLDRRSLRPIQREYRQDNLNKKRSTHASVLLMHCRPTISLDPILWLPMSKSERSRCIRWRLGWLPGGQYKTCPRHPSQPFTKAHAVHCLQMHRKLMMPETISDPLSFLLNMLPTRKPRSPNTVRSWTIRWPTICRILYELDYLFHAKLPPTPPTHLRQKLLEWLPSSPSH
ncbi:hypothetical protein G6F70_008529 [Rhizopus microsporus]|nr:hypothetical protein G6F70_008529 [Rhizopus microsporus]KAG1206901.1 hypothetical protein G6F69_008480 [Rhizopus microsporus]KAG1227554.1 hypothetical protein G6F67_008383 [Rhizopus microsporus]